MATEQDTDVQELEIAKLKDTFEGQVKVIRGVGDFTNVVTLTLKDADLQVKFQLTDGYPSSTATVSVRSSAALTHEEVYSLTTALQTEAQSLAGSQSIEAVLEACDKWIKDNDVDISEKDVGSKTKTKRGKSRPQNKKSIDKLTNVEEDRFVKKPPMKTASDVIKRLQWDTGVDKEAFIVGYMDRLTGIEERAFSAFVWEDLASVDLFALAIPQHRIQYFKYKDEKVWDKNERLDNVFGSTGSKITIVEAINAYENKYTQTSSVCTDNVADVDQQAEKQTATNVLLPDEETSESKSTEIGHLEQAAAELNLCELNDADGKIESTRRRTSEDKDPNYFLGLRITDDECINNFQAIQKVLSRQFPHYKDYAIHRKCFFITLSVARLETDTDVRQCVSALNDNEFQSKVVEICKLTDPLEFRGLSSFGSNVVFAEVKSSPRLRLLVDTIQTHLAQSEVQGLPNRNFNPHMTLFNVSRSRSMQADWPREGPVLAPLAETYFGKQTVDNIHLCPIITETHEFYISVLTIDMKQFTLKGDKYVKYWTV